MGYMEYGFTDGKDLVQLFASCGDAYSNAYGHPIPEQEFNKNYDFCLKLSEGLPTYAKEKDIELSLFFVSFIKNCAYAELAA